MPFVKTACGELRNNETFRFCFTHPVRNLMKAFCTDKGRGDEKLACVFHIHNKSLINLESQTCREMGTENHGSCLLKKMAGLPGMTGSIR